MSLRHLGGLRESEERLEGDTQLSDGLGRHAVVGHQQEPDALAGGGHGRLHCCALRGVSDRPLLQVDRRDQELVFPLWHGGVWWGRRRALPFHRAAHCAELWVPVGSAPPRWSTRGGGTRTTHRTMRAARPNPPEPSAGQGVRFCVRKTMRGAKLEPTQRSCRVGTALLCASRRCLRSGSGEGGGAPLWSHRIL